MDARSKDTRVCEEMQFSAMVFAVREKLSGQQQARCTQIYSSREGGKSALGCKVVMPAITRILKGCDKQFCILYIRIFILVRDHAVNNQSVSVVEWNGPWARVFAVSYSLVAQAHNADCITRHLATSTRSWSTPSVVSTSVEWVKFRNVLTTLLH